MPSNFLAILLLLWAAGALVADDKPAGVEGTVTNALTGEPLVRAHVSLRGIAGGEARNLGALTNAEGKFSIASLPAGSYTATADHVGFTATAEHGRTGVQVVLRAGDKKDDVKLELTPTGAITGRVVDADGESVEGLTVAAERGDMGMRASGTTDEKGQFRIGGLAPGKYRVKATPMNMPVPPEIRTDGTVEVHYTPTYHPSSATEKGAARVEVRAGAEMGGIGIQLQRAPIVRISGTVTGFPPEAQRVMIECRQGWSARGMGTVRPDGTFEIWRVDPGKYRVSASSNSNGQFFRTGAVEVEVADANVDHVDLRMVPPSDIAGQVEYEDEQAKQPPPPPQTGQQQTAPRKPPPRRLILRDAAVAMPPFPQPAEVGEDGSFRLEAVQPGRYRVTTSWGPVYIKSMRLGQTTIEGNVLDLTNGSGGATLSVLVSSAVAEISGVVRDDKGPAAGVRVALVPADAELGAMPNLAMSGADGSYRLAGLAPGKYKLAAVEERALGGLQSIESDYEDVLETVEIGAGDKLTRDLKSK